MKLPNIVVRALAGAVFVGLLIGGLLINEYTFAIIFFIVTGLSLYEFYGLIEKDAGILVSKILASVGGLLLFGGTFFYYSHFSSTIVLASYILFLLFLFIRELYLKQENPIRSLAYIILGQVYIALPFALTNYIVFSHNSYSYVLLLSILIIIWVNDTFAYLTGMTFGKHKMFERISPKKSWEGFAGGLVAALFAGYIISLYSNVLSLYGWLGFALIVVIFGTWGDLLESLLKRTLGVKDSGNMIPGHGGILDRFDSTLLAIPSIAMYLMLIQNF